MKNTLFGLELDENISNREKIEALVEQIKYDPVTGIYNKYVFLDCIGRRLQEMPDKDFDMVCLSIEGYNLILDRYGQEKCYAMLKNICEKLQKVLPPGSIIGKYGESEIEFLVPSQPIVAHEQCMEACKAMFKSNQVAIKDVITNCGVYQHVDHTLSPEVICHNASLAAETIAHQYNISLAIYDNSIREKVLREQFIFENMFKALELRQFIVYYQPKFSINDETVNGAEALVRWIHPDAGFMNPGEFISVFEHNGFIQELDRYMLDAVCRDIKGWMNDGLNVVPVSINVSQANFDNKDIADEFTEIVDKYGIPHEYIHFEITESTNAADIAKKKYNVELLRNRGFFIELDDFGAGYSSMSSLCDIPIDILKLDMSLVQKMFEKKHSAVLSGALFTARELALKVIAEGVETKEQIEEMRFKGAYIKDFSVQGFYYSKPIPKLQFEKYLKKTSENERQEPSLASKNVVRTIVSRDSDGVNGQFENDVLLKKYKTLMEVPGTVIYDYDPRTDLMTMEIQLEDGKIAKRTSENYLEVLPKKHWIHDDSLPAYLETIRMVVNYGEPRSVFAKSITKEGGYQNCKYHFAPIKNENGVVIRVVGRAENVEDIDIKASEAKVVSSTFRYDRAGNQTFRYVSESLVKMLGFTDEESFRKFYDNSFINFVYEEDREKVLRGIEEQVSEGYIDYCEYRVKKADGSLLWVFDKGTLITDENGNEFFYVSITDLDEYNRLKQTENMDNPDTRIMKYKSETRQDKMTKLDNREFATKLIQKYLDSKDSGTFFLLDIDDFKQINDTRGHVVGDKVLCQVADVLRTAFRDGDVVGRYGGDEFICYMSGINKKNVAERKAASIIEKTGKIVVGDGGDNLSVSVGVVTDVLEAKDIEDLVAMAEKALNDIKKKKDSEKYAFY